MSRVMKIAVVLLLCWAAPLTLYHAHNSAAWQSVLMFAIYLPWPSTETANLASHICEAFLGVFVGGAYSTLLAVSTRLSAVASAAILSFAVFVSRFYLLLSPLYGSGPFLSGHLKMTAAFFAGGWLISALVLSMLWRRDSRRSAPRDGV